MTGHTPHSLVFDIRHVTTKEYWCPKRTSSIQYAIENGELMHECFPKHLRMGTPEQQD